MPDIGTFWRGLRVTEHVFTGALLALAAGLSRRVGLQCRWVPPTACWWHQRLCRCLALRIESIGEPAPNALLIANHVSWLDVPALGALGRLTFVSKDEVRNWPVVGGLATAAGTLFIKRGANQASDVIQQIACRIEDGGAVLVFPEGTTSDGRALRRFHPRLFAAAQRARAGLQPVAIRYGSKAEPDPVAPFIGEESLVAHLFRVFRHPGIRVEIAFLTPIDPTGCDRRTMADAARSAIGAHLHIENGPAELAQVPRPGRRPRTTPAG
ncbi:MAG: lysophospholipid acyltransferase family protein [Thiohalocapsa sp.]